MSAAEPSCITELTTEKLSFRWVIKDIRLFLEQQAGDAIKSSRFPSQEPDRGKWHLTLGLSTADEDQQYMSIFLYYTGDRDARAEAVFSIIDASQQELNKRVTGIKSFCTHSRGWGFCRFIARSALECNSPQLLQNGDLVIRCALTVVHGYVNTSRRCENGDTEVAECRLSEDLGWLLDSGSHADISVKVGGGTYRVHKAILASRSPVFRAMLSHDMLEATEGEIVISDIAYDVFGELLRFVYTGHSRNLRGMAASLLEAADKYCLQRLRDMCEGALIECLDVDNAAEALILGERHNAVALRRRAFDFICAHGSEVTETDGWATLMKYHAYLAEDVVHALFGRSKNSTEPPTKRRRT